MIFTAKLSDFQNAVLKALPAIPRKSTLPVLEHLHFTLDGDKLHVVATDQEITIRSSCHVEGEDNGSVLVPGRKISEIVKALGAEGTIHFFADPETFEIKIKTSFGRYNMKGLDPEEYLNLPELYESEKPDLSEPGNFASQPNSALIKRDDINRIAEKTVFAVSSDEFRPAMNGVFLQFRKDKLNAVATDSFRLVKCVILSPEESFPEDLEVIVPARAMDILKRIDKDVTVSAIENRNKFTHIRFDIEDWVLVSRLIDEKFPAYETVIPHATENIATIDQSQLLASVRRAAILTSAVNNQIKLKLDEDNLIITGEDEETGSIAEESLPCSYKGKQIDVGFNFRYLEDAIQNIVNGGDAKEILICMTESNKPVLIKPQTNTESLLMLIMPVRI